MTTTTNICNYYYYYYSKKKKKLKKKKNQSFRPRREKDASFSLYLIENEFPKITTTTLQSSASRAIAEHCLRVFVCLCEIIVCRSCSLVLVVVVLKFGVCVDILLLLCV